MAITFPPSPTPGQTFVGGNGVTYTYNNTLGVWTASGQGGTVISPATLAEAAAGTLASVYSSPQTAVPKDASGMTGAAILPSGTTLQQPTTPVVGMTRFNTDLTPDSLEVYNGANWKQLAYVSTYDPAPADLVISANTTLNGNILCKNLTINAGVTVTVANYGIVIYCTGTATINGSINADNAGGVGYPATSPGYGAGSGVQTGGNTPSGWNGPGVTGKTYATGFYLGGSSPVSSYWELDATGVSSGYVRTAGSAGGGCIAIRAAGGITVAATSTLSAKGQNGGGFTSASGNASLPGMSGGSGGTVILHSDTSISMAGTINVQGGNGGGAGCGGTGCSRGLGGGNGGGGGQVILQSPSTTNTGTVTLTAGTGGPGINGAGVGLQLGAAQGAGNGGTGGPGSPGGSSVNGNAGTIGIISYSGSPF